MPIKGAHDLIPLAFYLAVTAVVCSAMSTNEELAKNLEDLSKSVKSIKDTLATFERGHGPHTVAQIHNRQAPARNTVVQTLPA